MTQNWRSSDLMGTGFSFGFRHRSIVPFLFSVV